MLYGDLKILEGSKELHVTPAEGYKSSVKIAY